MTTYNNLQIWILNELFLPVSSNWLMEHLCGWHMDSHNIFTCRQDSKETCFQSRSIMALLPMDHKQSENLLPLKNKVWAYFTLVWGHHSLLLPIPLFVLLHLLLFIMLLYHFLHVMAFHEKANACCARYQSFPSSSCSCRITGRDWKFHSTHYYYLRWNYSSVYEETCLLYFP